MTDSRLSVLDRELFLAEPHIAALSVSAGPDRGPLTLPIWYQYAPGGEPWVLTEAGSRKVRLIETAGWFTLMVERTMPTFRYVSVEGPVARIVPGTEEMLLEITERYLPPDKVPAYIEFAKAELGEQVAIYLRPQRWLTADLGPGSLPPTPPGSLPDGSGMSGASCPGVARTEPPPPTHFVAEDTRGTVMVGGQTT
jgi:Pyridoxamine 5'-phosphate oxidase